MTKWKTIKIREADYDLLSQLQATLRDTGIAGLPEALRDQLSDGVTAGALVSAAMALLQDSIDGKNGKRRSRP